MNKDQTVYIPVKSEDELPPIDLLSVQDLESNNLSIDVMGITEGGRQITCHYNFNQKKWKRNGTIVLIKHWYKPVLLSELMEEKMKECAALSFDSGVKYAWSEIMEKLKSTIYNNFLKIKT